MKFLQQSVMPDPPYPFYRETVVRYTREYDGREASAIVRLSDVPPEHYEIPRKALVLFGEDDPPGTPRIACHLTREQLKALGEDLIAIAEDEREWTP